ncbi:MAG: hypothetical protein L3J91_05135 [Thermoplasmata archaeon]|nr:hypothetical protein [Thermoplasmata archaeon]
MASAPPVTEEQVQQDLMRLDAYRGQLNQLVQQHQYLSASRGDHLRAKESLEGLDRVGAAQELEGQIRALDERVQVLARRIDSVTQNTGAFDAPGATSNDVGVD